jgi:hypothetical protein
MTAQKINPPVLSHEAGPKNENLQTAIVANDGTDRQAFALLKWQAAKVQQTLVKTTDGYTISRWGQTRHCICLSEVATILQRMGARP